MAWASRGGGGGKARGLRGGPPPDRVDQLLGFCTQFRPPVYSTPEVRGNADTTLVGEVDMFFTQRDTDLTARVPVVGDSRAAADLEQNPGATPGVGEVLMARIKAMQTMQTPIGRPSNTVDFRVVGLLGGG